MSGGTKSGLAFIFIAIVMVAIGFWLLDDIRDQLTGVIQSLSGADPSVAILERVVDQCDYLKPIISVLAGVMFGLGFHFTRSAKEASKG